ncbi:hypothetical protein SDC9_196768 [bioreactor metagenome]|uniref:Uncharacterized protein n=1 Tax=bioreactor metagenome TaxID=1076179 RepID=A0A645ILG0_9ZZZZ
MADKVKVIHVGHILVSLHAVKVDALVLEHGRDSFLLFFRRPFTDKVIQRRVGAQNV